MNATEARIRGMECRAKELEATARSYAMNLPEQVRLWGLASQAWAEAATEWQDYASTGADG